MEFNYNAKLFDYDPYCYKNLVDCVYDRNHQLTVDMQFSNHFNDIIKPRDIKIKDPYQLGFTRCYMPVVTRTGVKIPGDIDKEFRKFKKTYINEISRTYGIDRSDEYDSIFRSMSRPQIFMNPFPNVFVSKMPINSFSTFIDKESDDIIRTFQKIYKEKISRINYVPTYVRKSTSPGLRIDKSGNILASTDFEVATIIKNGVARTFKDFSDLKKWYFEVGTNNLPEVKDRNFLKNPVDSSDFENFTAPIIVPGSRTNNLDHIDNNFLTKDREVMFYDNGKVFSGYMSQKKLTGYFHKVFPFLDNDQLTPLRYRLVMCLVTQFAARFFPICRVLMHDVESGPRHFINANEDLKSDYKNFCKKYKPEAMVSIDQSQCDRIMSRHVNVVMGVLPQHDIIQTCAYSWIFNIGFNTFISLTAMPSGAPWTTVCNHYFSYLKWAMIFSLIELGRFEKKYILQKIEEICLFFESKVESIHVKSLGTDVYIYLFACTDNMDASFSRMDDNIKQVLQFAKDEFKLNYVVNNVVNTFGHDIDVNGNITPSVVNMLEKIMFTENSITPGHAVFNLLSRTEMYKDIYKIYVDIMSSIYKVSINTIRSVLQKEEDIFINALRAANVSISHIIRDYAQFTEMQYHYLVGKGINDDIDSIDSMHAFMCKSSKLDDELVVKNLEFYRKEVI